MVGKEHFDIDELRKVFAYCAETGEITYIVRHNRKCRIGGVAGMISKGYLRVCYRKKLIAGHRLAWLLHYGAWPSNYIDHINGNRADNRIQNLREVDHKTNRENLKKALKNNKIGILGVRQQGSGFHARIRVDGKEISLGTHPTAEEAHNAYLAAKRQMHKGCAI